METASYLNASSLAGMSNNFEDLDKFVLQFRQIHSSNWTNIFTNLEISYVFELQACWQVYQGVDI